MSSCVFSMDPSFDVIVCWINDKPTKFNKASIAEQFQLSKESVVLGGIYDIIFKLPNGRRQGSNTGKLAAD